MGKFAAEYFFSKDIFENSFRQSKVCILSPSSDCVVENVQSLGDYPQPFQYMQDKNILYKEMNIFEDVYTFNTFSDGIHQV